MTKPGTAASGLDKAGISALPDRTSRKLTPAGIAAKSLHWSRASCIASFSALLSAADSSAGPASIGGFRLEVRRRAADPETH